MRWTLRCWRLDPHWFTDWCVSSEKYPVICCSLLLNIAIYLVDLPIKYDDFYSKLLVCQKVIYISIYGITTNQFLTALLLRKPLISVACFPFPGKNEFHDGFPTLTYLDPETEQKWQWNSDALKCVTYGSKYFLLQATRPFIKYFRGN